MNKIKSTVGLMVFACLLQPNYVDAKKMGCAPKDTVKLAIVMGGAVSLGAFEAGVIAELVRKLEFNNHSDSSECHYVIDILAGASAGSMTIGVLARELFHSKSYHTSGSASYESESSFYQAWVKEIDIKKLLTHKRKNLQDSPFLFSSDSIRAIAEKFISGDNSGHRLCLAPDTLHMAMTLSNMNGIRKSIEFANTSVRDLDFALYDDVRYFEISRGNRIAITDAAGKCVAESNWDDVKETALASGAFPFAFEPIKLSRYPNEAHGLSDTTYIVDGGYFNNEPLNVAKEIARRVDKPYYRQQARFKRKFIYIAPRDVKENDNTADNRLDVRATTELGKYLQQLFKMGYATARTIDQRLYLENERGELGQNLSAIAHSVYSLHDSTDVVENLLKAIQVLSRYGFQFGDFDSIKKFAQTYPQLFDNEQKIEYSRNLGEIFKKLAHSTGSENCCTTWLSATTNRNLQQLYVDLFFMTGNRPRDRYILISNDDKTKLGGSNFANFGGFLKEEIREYDYQLGRYFAGQALKELGIRGPVFVKPQPKKWDTLQEHIAEIDRPALRRRLDKRLVAYSGHIDIPGPNTLLTSPLLKAADHSLDKHLYRTPETLFFTWHINSDRPRSFNLGLMLNPLNLLQTSYTQPKGFFGWFGWFLVRESHFVLDVGLTDFLLEDAPWIKAYYTNLGLRFRLFHPTFWSFIKLQPEVGLTRAWDIFEKDTGVMGNWGTYTALTLRVTAVELKVQRFYPVQPFANGSDWRINFGLSSSFLDQSWLNRL